MLTDGGADGVRHQRFRTSSISAFVEAPAIFQKTADNLSQARRLGSESRRLRHAACATSWLAGDRCKDGRVRDETYPAIAHRAKRGSARESAHHSVERTPRAFSAA